MARKAWCGWLCLVIFSAALASAEAAERARILRVVHEREQAPANSEAAPVELRLGRFLLEDAATPTGEVFRVEWQPVGQALRAGVVLRFEYRQERVREMQQLMIRYPFDVRERRTATFEIGPAALQSGGTVTAWRVRVEQESRVLAEKRSSSWAASTP